MLEYKEEATGKLRHRSFRIDVNRFETAVQCERKLWGRLSKAIVPGSLQPSQVGKLVAQLFQHEKQQNPDEDELEAATERFMSAQVEEPTPTRSGLKPMPLADSRLVKPNQLPAEPTRKKWGSSGAGSSGDDVEGDKENSPNLDLPAGRGASSPSASSSTVANAVTSPGANASASPETSKAGADSPAARERKEVEEVAGDSASKKLQPLPRAASPSSVSSLLAGMPALPGTLGGGGAQAGRRAGLAPLGGGGGGITGGFGSLTSSLGLPDDDDEPVFSFQAAKREVNKSRQSTPVHTDLNVESPASAFSSKDSGADRFLGVGVTSQASSGAKSPLSKDAAKEPEPKKEDSFELEEEVVEDEDIPDYADDFENDFEDEDDNDLSLPLPGSNAKDKVGAEKNGGEAATEEGADADDGEAEAAAERERLRLRGDDVDLNKVEESELDTYKRLMEEEFQQKAIKPGDPNWQHDVQVDFGDAEEDCGWDEEDEEAEEEEDAF